MGQSALTVEMVSHRAWLRQEITRREGLLGLVVDLDAALRTLAALREELAVLDMIVGGVVEPSDGAEAVYDLTPTEAAAFVSMGRRTLVDRVERTPAALRPCIDISTGGSRRHFRFNRAQLEVWAKEKPWQASDPTPEDGPSAGASPTLPVQPAASSGPGSAPTPKPRPRSTGRKPRPLRVVASGGARLTGDPDLDALA